MQSRNRNTEVENKSMTLRGEDGGGMDWEIGTDACTLLHMEQMAGAVLHCAYLLSRV